MSEVAERIKYGLERVAEKFEDAGKYVVEKYPEVAKTIVSMGLASASLYSILLTLSVFPNALVYASIITPILLMLIQISVSIMIMTLIIGIARRLI
ncbi:MAG: hypothetical protein C0179_00775 [Fervidicoccus sp.]|nr:MAG: hypothetical protein C0179_00775 [Fervidicoccus sp.]